MATAYLAAVQGPGGFNKLIVVKRLRPALAEEPEFLRMFMEEARLSARIDHPNVVHTNEVGFDGEHHFISMEYLDGQSLESVLRRILRNAQRLKSDGSPASEPSGVGILETLPLKYHLYVLSQTLQGLDFAHELKDFDGEPLNVVHRDVSPHNVMVTYEGGVKVLDFGIAKAADSSGDTRTGVMKGKCAYMPAEQFGGKQVDRRADVFSVGVMMWQALTGRKLWRGLSDAEIFQKLATDQIPTVRSAKPDVPEDLEAICMKALAASPEGRYSTAAEFQAAIDDYVAGHKDLRVTSRELGKYVSELFSEDRAKIRGVIEAQLGKAGKSKGPTSLPQLGVNGPTSHTGSMEVMVPPISGTPVARSVPEGMGVQEVSQEGRRGRVALFGGIALVAVAAIVGTLLMRSRANASSSQPSDTATVSSGPAPTSSPGDTTSVVTITTNPPDAKIMFDDAPLSASPATGRFRRDGARHHLRVEAPGYLPHSEWVVLDSSQTSLDVSLERDKGKGAPGSTAKGSAPAVWAPAKPSTNGGGQTTAAVPTPPPTPTATGGHPPPTPTATSKVGIDTGDPWAPAKKP
jgi:serine/threonine-protein kinase